VNNRSLHFCPVVTKREQYAGQDQSSSIGAGVLHSALPATFYSGPLTQVSVAPDTIVALEHGSSSPAKGDPTGALCLHLSRDLGG